MQQKTRRNKTFKLNLVKYRIFNREWKSNAPTLGFNHHLFVTIVFNYN